jgi:sec-independent protein translocase protein TatA
MLTSILQPTHLIIVLAVALLVLGPKRLPEAGRALGQGLREFRGSITGAHDDDPQDQVSTTSPAAPDPPANNGMPQNDNGDGDLEKVVDRVPATGTSER